MTEHNTLISDEPKLVLSLNELCQHLRISLGHLHNLRRQGRGPNVIKLGARTVVRIEEAQRWLASLEQQQKKAA